LKTVFHPILHVSDPIMMHVEQILLPFFTVKNGLLIGCNNIFSDVFGYDNETLKQHRLQDILTIESDNPQSQFDINQLFSRVRQSDGVKTQGMIKNQHHYSLHVEIFCQSDSNAKGTFNFFFRVLEDKSQDLVTGLPNGWAISSRANHLLNLPEQMLPQLAVIIFKVDNFSTLNFRQGYHVGDEYLTLLGLKVQQLMGKENLVVRFSNAKYGILVEDYNQLTPEQFKDYVTSICQALCDISSSPIELDNDVLVHKNFSIGVSEVNAFYKSYFAMEIATETAMHQASKFSTSKFIFATSKITDRLLTKKLIIDDLPQAIAQQHIVMHYQPQYCLVSKKIMGLEALSRWQHEYLGYISPAFFVGIAEEIGLHFEFDLFVFKQVCHQIQSWKQLGYAIPRVSINISFKTLERDAFVTRIEHIINETKCPTDCIEIEVTETTSIKNIDGLFENMNQVQQLGIHIAIDDFGSGYSSLSLIRTLHQSLDKLKLDKSLIDNICYTTIDRDVVKQIIELGGVLGLDVLAEGIEHPEQQALLSTLGCKFGQGYLFEKPLPPEDIVEYFTNI